MSRPDLGGSAFPVPHDTFTERQMGLTVRDYFAAKAMQGIAASSLKYNDTAEAARDAYRIADAMIAERAK